MAFDRIEDFAAAMPPAGALAGLDLGTVTIGIAVSDGLRSVATPIETIKRKKFGKDAAALLAICTDRDIKGLVLGLPLNMDGTEHELSRAAKRFANQLHGRFRRHIGCRHPRSTKVWSGECLTINFAIGRQW